MGIILSDQKKYDKAIDYYNKCISIDPKFAHTYSNLGNVYLAKNNLKKAEECYFKSIELNDKISEPHNNLGNVFRSKNKHKEALASYKKAIEIDPNFFWAYYNLATTHIALGNYIDSEKALEKTIKINPYFCPAHRSLSRVKRYKKNDEHLSQMQNIYKNKKIDDIQKKELSFALGKAYEDVGDYISSFEYYKIANKLHRKDIIFSIEEEKREFNKIKEIYANVLFEKNNESLSSHPKVIFIVGMPRSGTTLVEQIISSHPDVFGCDELNLIPNLVKKAANIDKLNDKELSKFKNEYLNNVKEISNNAKIVTDKLPINFKWLGFIKLILPNSKIIHCVRNSKDNCFSIFKSYFPSQINFAFDIEEIVEFYNLYLDLMNFWNKLLPNSITSIKYENIINKHESEIKNLIKSCDLQWNDQCLKFYNNTRPIKTASDTQARKKIYKTSIDSWKNYEKNLNIFFRNLSK